MRDALNPVSLAARISAALAARTSLHADERQTAYRLFHGYGEGMPGLEIDRWGPVATIVHHAEHAADLPTIRDLLLSSGIGLEHVVARPRRGRVAARSLGASEPPQEVIVHDNGLRLAVEPLAVGSPGLFLDARPARSWLLSSAGSGRVLNLFAYTGSLGLAARCGGCASVEHVELQKRALQRLKRNHELNELRVDGRDLHAVDLYPFLRRAQRQGRSFDGIILDPPPRVPGKPDQDYATLAALAGALLRPGGWLLCFFSRFGTTRAEYETLVGAASPVALDVLWQGASGIDFPESEPEAKLRFTAFRAGGPA